MLRARIPVARVRAAGRRSSIPTEFDADAWVSLAKRAGQKYLVITAKHHDGFCMYDSQVSDYDIVDATPFGRDPMQGPGRGVPAQHGIKLCFYYSQTQDWHHPDGDGNDWDYDEAARGLRRLPRDLRQAAGPRAADRLRPDRPDLVRHAEAHHARSRARSWSTWSTSCSRSAWSTGGSATPSGTTPRRATTSSRTHLRRTRTGRPRRRSTTPGASSPTTTTGSPPRT